MNRQGASFACGDVIAKDDKSITIKMRDGSSKTIFYSDTSEISKSIKGTADDLTRGH